MSQDPLLENVKAVVDLERHAVEHRTTLDSVADTVTAFAGSRGFVLGQIVLHGLPSTTARVADACYRRPT